MPVNVNNVSEHSTTIESLTNTLEAEALAWEMKQRELAVVVDAMLKAPKIVPKRVDKQSIVLEILKRIPYLADLVESIGDTGWFVSSLTSVHSALQNTSTGFDFTSLSVEAFNFIRVPLVYLSAKLLGIDSPITVSRGAKFVYSGVMLGLGLAGALVPGAFPLTLLVMSILAVGVSVMTLAKLWHDKVEISAHLKVLDKQIKEQDALLEHLRQDAEGLLKKLRLAVVQNRFGDAQQLSDELKLVHDVYQDTMKKSQTAHNERAVNEERNKHLGFTAALDRGVGSGLATLGLVGAILMLFIPPAGMAIMAATAALGGAYLVGRWAVPFVHDAVHWLKKKWGSKNHSVATEASAEGSQSTAGVEATTVVDVQLDVHRSPEAAMLQLGGANEVVVHREEVQQMDSAAEPSNNKPGVDPALQPDGLCKGDGEGDGEGVKEKDSEGEGEGNSDHSGLHL